MDQGQEFKIRKEGKRELETWDVLSDEDSDKQGDADREHFTFSVFIVNLGYTRDC